MCDIEEQLRDWTAEEYKRSLDRKVWAAQHPGSEGIRLMQELEAAGINLLCYNLVERVTPDLDSFTPDEVEDFYTALVPEMRVAYQEYIRRNP